MVLDGGPARIGIESTVLSLNGPDAVLLRPGMISAADIATVIGPVRTEAAPAGEAHPSPGMHPKHYSPQTPLFVIERGELPAQGRGAYLWIGTPAGAERSIRMPIDPHAYAAILYKTLHEVDAGGFDWIAVERPPSGLAWSGICDRLERASAR